MLPDLDWLPRLAAALLATGLLVLFLVRAIRKDRREYARFRRYRSTVRRQAMLRRWLIESLALFGGKRLTEGISARLSEALARALVTGRVALDDRGRYLAVIQ